MLGTWLLFLGIYNTTRYFAVRNKAAPHTDAAKTLMMCSTVCEVALYMNPIAAFAYVPLAMAAQYYVVRDSHTTLRNSKQGETEQIECAEQILLSVGAPLFYLYETVDPVKAVKQATK